MDEPQRGRDRPQPPTLTHASPAGEPTARDRPATTTGPEPGMVQRWQEAAAGRTATNPSVANDHAKPTGVGPSSRDTPAPSGEAARAAGTRASGEPPAQAQAADPAHGKATPGESRPPRPVPKGATPAPARDDEALVEAITERLAQNLAKALRQSVVEAVQGAATAPRPPDASDVPAGQAAQAKVGPPASGTRPQA